MRQQELIIKPGYSEKNYWRDLWNYRELFYILSWRDIKVRYKQTVIGSAWSIVRPVLTTVIFTFIFGRVANLPPMSAAPYALMVYAGMLPWQFFSNGLTETSSSLVGNANLISKIYFPRIIVPASSIITSLVDFLISFAIMIVMFVWYGFMPPVQVLLFPLFVIMAFFCSFGIGLYFTAVNVKYRDFRYVLPFIIQFGLYVTPVGYSSEHIANQFSDNVRLLYSLNPMAGIIDCFRWCLLGDPFYLPGFILSLVVCIVCTYIGFRYFRKMEKTFADHI